MLLSREQVERVDELLRLLEGTESADECHAIIATAFSEGLRAGSALPQQREEELDQAQREIAGLTQQLSETHNLYRKADASWRAYDAFVCLSGPVQALTVRGGHSILVPTTATLAEIIDRVSVLTAQLAARTAERDVFRASMQERLADYGEACDREQRVKQQLAVAQARVKELEEALNIDELVNRFLRWPLPHSVCADLCASKQGYPNRSGTTLLSAFEAKAMIVHLLHQALTERPPA